MVFFDEHAAVAREAPKTVTRQRQDWVRADVLCLMCGRLLGRLLGTARRREHGARSAGQPVSFIAYRPLNPVARIVPFTPYVRFRCRACGGAGAVDRIELFSTYDEPPPDNYGDDELPRRGPGRPARPFPPQERAGIRAALNEL